ncbi:MAG: hypothetical protein H7Y02_04715 [Candidatus Obscuribacterales bacterium]|nr:hypothetical protein [Steroidobacteraceae bacterium]
MARVFVSAKLALSVAAITLLLAACGGGEPSDDKITLGGGQGSGAGTDPGSVDFPIFYVKRPVPDPMAQPSNVLQIRQFDPGADLYMRASASPSATETNLTASLTNNLGDVRDVDVSYDGRKVIFAMRFPFIPNAQEEDLPTWNIWEYDITARTLRSVMADTTVAEAGNDRFPHYLPDGRIIFSSTRQRTSQAILLDEGKSQYQGQDENNREPASVLHVMDANGGNIKQVTFNQSHDLDSAVLANGQIVFSRWDGAAATDHVDLYRMNPDGSNLELLYGKQATTHATGTNTVGTNNTVIQFLSPKQMPDGRVLALVRPMTGTEDAGDFIYIDTNVYVENTQPTLPNAGLAGPAQQRATPALAVSTAPGPSAGGRFRSVFPLNDGSARSLVSWSPCRLIENGLAVSCTAQRLAITPALPQAQPLFGIWIFNQSANTQLPIVTPLEGTIMSDVVAGAPRTAPPVILDRVPGIDYANELEAQAAGIIDIRSVYDIQGVDTAPGGIGVLRNPSITTANQRPARFLRIEKAVSLPDDDVRDIRNTSFGPTGRFMREIIGYAPIEPDGSVRVKVPANVAIQLTTTDRNARRLSPLHRNWIQLRPGQVLNCNGCHTTNAPPPPAVRRSHGRSDLFASVNPGAPANGLFPSTDATLLGNPGDSMALTRARVMCPLSLSMAACAPSVNVVFNDLWTDPIAAGRGKDTTFDYCYSAGPTDVAADPADAAIRHTCVSRLETTPPTTSGCETNWSSNCRVIINYIGHLQPLWDKERLLDPLDPLSTNRRCTTCHSPTDAMNQVRVPAGQLDLSATQDINQPDHFVSYRKLLFNHNAQELNATMTGLQDVCLQTDPITGVCIQFDVVSGSMAAANARNSRFFSVMVTAGATVNHTGFMTEAEQRLISEWLDIGAQYYNDPFLAPEN